MTHPTPRAVPLPIPVMKSAPPHIERLLAALDGVDVERSLQTAATIINEGEWRTWMVRWFIRRHRSQASRLMRRLGPMLPPSRRR